MQEKLWIDKPIDKTVVMYTKNTMDRVRWCGMLSIRGRKNTRSMRRKIPLTITPGVRFADGDVGDQKRGDNTCKSKRAWL